MRIFLIFIIMFYASISFADTCPSIHAIKQHQLHGFTMYDSYTDQPLPATRVSLFQRHVKQFILAEWRKDDNQHHAIRCYYRDQYGSELDTYLSKNNFTPDSGKSYWYTVTGSMHCAASSKECTFQHIAQEHLATK
ncbi:MAG: hypothetical protein A3F12_01880 [Gammaproteobacteria bacterium RIFCSPHIGHO2_12_FULL_38_14]|nr:MAG: hypothetical protein A3F12_01880 [Gammaproteobacteria bacterium RIFCSPHIGHO2_12_FULL_38_14]